MAKEGVIENVECIKNEGLATTLVAMTTTSLSRLDNIDDVPVLEQVVRLTHGKGKVWPPERPKFKVVQKFQSKKESRLQSQ